MVDLLLPWGSLSLPTLGRDFSSLGICPATLRSPGKHSAPTARRHPCPGTHLPQLIPELPLSTFLLQLLTWRRNKYGGEKMSHHSPSSLRGPRRSRSSPEPAFAVTSPRGCPPGASPSLGQAKGRCTAGHKPPTASFPTTSSHLLHRHTIRSAPKPPRTPRRQQVPGMGRAGAEPSWGALTSPKKHPNPHPSGSPCILIVLRYPAICSRSRGKSSPLGLLY